jgi:hypothetical protein
VPCDVKEKAGYFHPAFSLVQEFHVLPLHSDIFIQIICATFVQRLQRLCNRYRLIKALKTTQKHLCKTLVITKVFSRFNGFQDIYAI